MAAFSDQHVEQVPWKEIFGVCDDDETGIESVKLKHVAVVGVQESLASELVECFVAKPSVVSVGFHQSATSGAHSKFDIMPVCFFNLCVHCTTRNEGCCARRTWTCRVRSSTAV